MCVHGQQTWEVDPQPDGVEECLGHRLNMDQGSMGLSAQPQTSSTAKNRATCRQPWLASTTPPPRLDSTIWEGGWA